MDTERNYQTNVLKKPGKARFYTPRSFARHLLNRVGKFLSSQPCLNYKPTFCMCAQFKEVANCLRVAVFIITLIDITEPVFVIIHRELTSNRCTPWTISRITTMNSRASFPSPGDRIRPCTRRDPGQSDKYGNLAKSNRPGT